MVYLIPGLCGPIVRGFFLRFNPFPFQYELEGVAASGHGRFCGSNRIKNSTKSKQNACQLIGWIRIYGADIGYLLKLNRIIPGRRAAMVIHARCPHRVRDMFMTSHVFFSVKRQTLIRFYRGAQRGKNL